jgi:ADP-ribosylglycohydrolase
MDSLSRTIGCLYGLAIGDALGFPVEFASRRDIIERHGPSGVQDFQPCGPFRPGSFSDDTQMTVATAEGLVRARVVGRLNDPIPFIYDAYLTWLWSQELPENVRAPGRTCLTALRSGECGTVEQPLNNSKGCGGTMRLAPIGLVYEPTMAFEIAARAAAITHGHPSGYLSAGFLAGLISEIMGGVTLMEAINRSIRRLQGWPGHEETLGRIWQALDLVGTGIAAHDCIHAIGGGWVGEEALAIALFCSLRLSSYKDAVLAAVNHSGDSDSTGSICGSIMGTLLGMEAIPLTWIQRVESSAMLRQVAAVLVQETMGGYLADHRPTHSTKFDSFG